MVDGRIALGVAAVVSLALHGAGLAIAPGQEAVYLPPSAGGDVAMVGNAFEDMAAGTVSSLEPGEDVTQTVVPDAQPPIAETPSEAEAPAPTGIEPIENHPTDATPVETTTPTVEPPPATVSTPSETEPTPVETAEPVASPVLVTTSATAPTVASVASPVAPEAPPTTAAAAPSPQESVTVSEPVPVQTVTTETVTEALPDEDPITMVYQAPRPPARPDELVPEEMLRPEPEPEPVRQEPEPERQEQPHEQPPAQPEGNAEANQVAGIQNGAEEGDAPSEGQGNAAQVAEDGAAAANYPGLVMARLSQTRRDRVDGRGTAVIAFSLSDSGGLAGLSVAQSSGNASVDNAGLALVQRAAPFPQPPSGAMRSFSFRFTGD